MIDENDPPTAIMFPSDATVPENGALDTVVGELSALDEDIGQTHVFTIQSQNPIGSLQVANGNQLLVANGNIIDFETLQYVKVTILVTDRGTPPESYIQTLDIAVLDKNEAPTMVTLDNHEVGENSPEGARVANIEIEDPDTFQQSFFCHLLEDSRGRFRIFRQHLTQQNQLVVSRTHLLNFEETRQHTIKIQCMDDGGMSIEHQFQIDVQNKNDPPSAILFFDGKNHNLTHSRPPNDTELGNHNIQISLVTIPENVGQEFEPGFIVAYVFVVDEDNENTDLPRNSHDCELISENDYKEKKNPRGEDLKPVILIMIFLSSGRKGSIMRFIHFQKNEAPEFAPGSRDQSSLQLTLMRYPVNSPSPASRALIG